MTHPNLKALALAAVEADAACLSAKRQSDKLDKGAIALAARKAFDSAATPERILELEDKLERLGALLQLISYNGHLPGSAHADIARIAIKSKEPSPSSGMENEHGK